MFNTLSCLVTLNQSDLQRQLGSFGDISGGGCHDYTRFPSNFSGFIREGEFEVRDEFNHERLYLIDPVVINQTSTGCNADIIYVREAPPNARTDAARERQSVSNHKQL